MNIIEQLNFPKFKATKLDKQLINYIKENKEEVIYKSISEIANENDIGEATVTRFTHSKKMDPKIISITQNKPSRLKDFSDINLSYISAETIFKTGAVSSKLAQIFLIDLIYTQVVKDMGMKAIERKVKTTEAISKLKNL